MPISPDTVNPPTDPAGQALDFLRGRPNPFDNLVRPQRPDDRFLDVHVPALLREPRELLLAVIDTYRLAEYRAASDLPDSRVVTILGPRGAGKTHLLEAVAYRDDHGRQLLVRPAYFEPGVAFDEYLLAQLVNALLTSDPVHGGRPFDAIAFAVTRRLLRLTLAELGPVERLLLPAPTTPHVPSGWARWRLLWGGGETLAGRGDHLLGALAGLPADGDLVALANKHGLAPELLAGLIEDHVQRWQKGDDALPAIRRQLLPALARAVLLHESNALTQFLESDYAPAEARPFYRSEIVRQLLFALVETCALVRLPVVVAFDNLEGLLAPQGKLDTERLRALFDSLAQAVDSSRGLLFLLFAEQGLYLQIRKEAHAFALTRIDQGVPVHARGPVDVIELRPPSTDEMDKLIAERVGRLLRGFGGAATLAPNFPLGGPFLADLAGRTSQELRNRLLRLRDEYSRIVYRREPPAVVAAPPTFDWNAELARAWDHHLLLAARRRQNRELVTLYHDFHAGLRQFLQQVGPVQLHGLELAGAEPMNTTDGHGTYGEVTIVDWRPVGRAAGNGEERPALRVAVGLLLAGRASMPRDLKAKFTPLTETRHQPDRVVVLWPAAAGQELPAATRQVWESNHLQYRAVLQRLSDDEVYKLLALPDWVKEVRGKADPQVPEDVMHHFVRQRCHTFLTLVAPGETVRTANHAH